MNGALLAKELEACALQTKGLFALVVQLYMANDHLVCRQGQGLVGVTKANARGAWAAQASPKQLPAAWDASSMCACTSGQCWEPG